MCSRAASTCWSACRWSIVPRAFRCAFCSCASSSSTWPSRCAPSQTSILFVLFLFCLETNITKKGSSFMRASHRNRWANCRWYLACCSSSSTQRTRRPLWQTCPRPKTTPVVRASTQVPMAHRWTRLAPENETFKQNWAFLCIVSELLY